MMFPPVIRMGQPPYQPGTFVVLVEKRGWVIGRWHSGYPDTFLDSDARCPPNFRNVNRYAIRCWMPGDGS